MKLLNNFLSMGYAALYAEALMIGAKVGLTPPVFDSVIRGGRMDCGFYQTFFKYVLERDRDAHKFSLRNGLKDVSYLAGLANASGAANPSAPPSATRSPWQSGRSRRGLCPDAFRHRGGDERCFADEVGNGLSRESSAHAEPPRQIRCEGRQVRRERPASKGPGHDRAGGW